MDYYPFGEAHNQLWEEARPDHFLTDRQSNWPGQCQAWCNPGNGMPP